MFLSLLDPEKIRLMYANVLQLYLFISLKLIMIETSFNNWHGQLRQAHIRVCTNMNEYGSNNSMMRVTVTFICLDKSSDPYSFPVSLI